MSWITNVGHVFKDIGKVALAVAPAAVSLVSPELGVLVQGVTSVVKAEVDHGGGTGVVKKTQAVEDISTSASTLAVPAENKLQLVGDLVEAILAVLKVIEKMFPTSTPEPPKTT